MNTSQTPTSTVDLILFENIGNFVKDLAGCFEHINILLYNRLLEKTTFQHKDSIAKHNKCFRTFYNENKKAILSKDVNTISSNIVFSDKIFIDISQTIKESSDEQVRTAIWNHLLKISSILDPDSNAKDMLKQNTNNEEEFISSMFSKIKNETSNMNSTNDNPMSAITSMMSSGVFSELVNNMSSGVNDGQLDLGKMLGMVTGLLGQMDTSGGSGNKGNTANIEDISKDLVVKK